MSTYKKIDFCSDVLSPEFSCAVDKCVSIGNGFSHPLTYTTFREIPEHLFGPVALVRSFLTFRTPYLDNAIVKLAYRAPPSSRTSVSPALRLIAQGPDGLGQIPTDLGTHAIFDRTPWACEGCFAGLLLSWTIGTRTAYRRYVIDSLLMALDVPVSYSSHPPPNGPWLLYAERAELEGNSGRCLYVPYRSSAWQSLHQDEASFSFEKVAGVPNILPGGVLQAHETCDIRIDLFANAFWFLSSWAEKVRGTGERYTRTVLGKRIRTTRHRADVVDIYLDVLRRELDACCERANVSEWRRPEWPHGRDYAVVLSHDVDFIPANQLDILKQGVKTWGVIWSGSAVRWRPFVQASVCQKR